MRKLVIVLVLAVVGAGAFAVYKPEDREILEHVKQAEASFEVG